VFLAAQSDALHARVQAFIASVGRGVTPEGFDSLAVAIARFQVSCSALVARLFRARGVDAAQVTSADDIPAVPCDAFRLARVASHPAELDTAVFRTSGTSAGVATRGEHAFRTTATYERSALTWSPRFLFPDGIRLVALVLAPELRHQPSSSLAFMIERLAHVFCGGAQFFLHPNEEGGLSLDADGLASAATTLRAEGKPAIVFATAFALVHALDQLGSTKLQLPNGSRVMQTGGFKGRSREVDADTLRAEVSETFGVPESSIVGEYGMTELSSPLYEATLAAALKHGDRVGPARRGVFVAPPWVRVLAVDPDSLKPLPTGAIGLARFVDLANVDSAVAVQTSDRIRIVDGGVELFGRAPGAVPRGCSIAMDDVLSPPA
jgi:hypothetical protein